jgi:hypothetical protein
MSVGRNFRSTIMRNSSSATFKSRQTWEMIMIASRLSSAFDFVRVDLYNVRGKIYFGELTFTPVAGLLKLKPESWDAILGERWKLSTRSDLSASISAKKWAEAVTSMGDGP